MRHLFGFATHAGGQPTGRLFDRRRPPVPTGRSALCATLILGSLLLVLSGCGTRENVPSTSGNAMAPSPHYRVGPEDVLRISVWGNKELTLDLVVRPDGKISVPLIQDIQAEGLTAAELADLIQQRLLGYIKEPHVSVIVLEVKSAKFYVVGEVKKPGTYFLRGDVSVLQALAMAEGFTTFASRRKIRLVRNAGGKQEVRVVNYYDMIGKGGEGNYLLRPGDTIVVP